MDDIARPLALVGTLLGVGLGIGYMITTSQSSNTSGPSSRLRMALLLGSLCSFILSGILWRRASIRRSSSSAHPPLIQQAPPPPIAVTAGPRHPPSFHDGTVVPAPVPAPYAVPYNPPRPQPSTAAAPPSYAAATAYRKS